MSTNDDLKPSLTIARQAMDIYCENIMLFAATDWHQKSVEIEPV